MESFEADPRRIEYAGENVDRVKVDYQTKYTTAQTINKARFDKFEVPYLGKDNNDYVNGQGFCCNNNKKLVEVILAMETIIQSYINITIIAIIWEVQVILLI